MIRELGNAIGGAYRLAFGLFTTAAAAGLWMGAGLLELLQHAAEWQLGMFTRGDGIEAGSESRIRMYFGVAKFAGVLVCTYLVPRYLYQDRDWQRVLRPDKDLMRGTIVVIGTLALTLGLIELSAAAAVHINVEQPWGLLIGVALTIPLVAVLPLGHWIDRRRSFHDAEQVRQRDASALDLGQLADPCLPPSNGDPSLRP